MVLRPHTRRNYECAAGIWFRFRRDQGLLLADEAVGHGMDRDGVNALIRHLQFLGRKNSTIWNRLMCLHCFMRIIDPVGYDGHIFHLNGISINEQFPRPPKPFEMHDTALVLDHVEQLFSTGLDAAGKPVDPLILRDAALVGLLVGHAPRIGNLTAMRLGEELRPEGDGWLVRFDERITKGKRRLEYRLSARCQVWLDAYLKLGRPSIATRATQDHLWLAPGGQPLTVHQASDIFRRFCKVYLGREHGPHISRKWLTSTAARRSPGAAADAAISLGHSEWVSQRCYREATSLHAIGRHGANLAQRRRAAARLLDQ